MIKVQPSKVRKLQNIAIRILVVIVAWYALSRQLLRHDDLDQVWDSFAENTRNISFWISLLPVFIGMLLNWSIEAFKWRLLTMKSEKISFFRALQAVCTGITVGTFTPNRVGEFIGRSFVLDKTHPWKTFFMTMVGSFAQLLITIIAGTAGFLFFASRYGWFSAGSMYLDIPIVFFAIAAVILLLLFYFHVDLIDHYFGRWIAQKRPGFAKWVHVLSEYQTRDLLKVLLMSGARYLVFSWQFIYLIHLFGLSIPYAESMVFLSVSYLVMTLIPTIALSELGVRGTVTLHFFGYYFGAAGYGAPETFALVGAATMLWLINLVVPALVGTLYVYRLRVFRNGNPTAE